MTVTLSPELSGLLGQVGGSWPDADEDQLTDMADGWRGLRDQVDGMRADSTGSVQAIGADNIGDAIAKFLKFWLDNIDRALGIVWEVATQVESILLVVTEALLAAKKAIIDALDWVARQIAKAKNAASDIPVIGGVISGAIDHVIEPIFEAARNIIVKVVTTVVDFVTKRVVPLLVTLLRKLTVAVEFLHKLVKRLKGEVPPERYNYTHPSGKPNPEAKPHGPRTRIEGNTTQQRSHELENEAADILARAGYDVEQNRRVPPHKPDYHIEGKVFDCYSPRPGTSVRNIAEREIRRKVERGQADRIVLNLTDWDGDVDDLREQLTNYPVPGLKEIMIIDGAGRIIHFYPF